MNPIEFLLFFSKFQIQNDGCVIRVYADNIYISVSSVLTIRYVKVQRVFRSVKSNWDI